MTTNGTVRNTKAIRDEVKRKMERSVIRSIIEDEKNFMKIREIITKDDIQDNTSRLLFITLDDFYKKEFKLPSQFLTKQLAIEYLCKLNTKNEVIEITDKDIDRLFSLNKEEEESFKKQAEFLRSYKIKAETKQTLDIAYQLLERNDDVKVVQNHLLEYYIKTYKDTDEKTKAYTYNELMRNSLAVLNPQAEKKVETMSMSPVGIFELDTEYLNGGLLEENFLIVAGRPGSGKTVLVKHMAKQAALRGKKVLFISLEMSAAALMKGYASQVARIDYGSVLNETISPTDYSRLMEEVEKEEESIKNFYVVESSGMTTTELTNTLITYKKQYDIDLFALDYVQLLKMPNGASPSEEQDYSEISTIIRTMTKSLKISGIVAAQVNRDCERRQDKHPVLSDMRNSGQFEQDATYVFTTYRDEYYDKNTEHPNEMDIDVVKNRYGKMGRVTVVFEGKYQNIASFDRVQSA